MQDPSIIEFDSIDSTNKYAMQLIDADKARNGLTIVAQSQTGGKGQRGKTWMDIPGQSLLMSIILTPLQPINTQFAFNALIATCITDALKGLDPSWELRIKWPNDIIINDKKAGGILIENVIRGSRWTHCVVGLGLNVKQENFPPELPHAISLKIASGKDIEMISLRNDIINNIIQSNSAILSTQAIMKKYNDMLYKLGRKQSFNDASGHWEATILGAESDGTLQVQLADGRTVNYQHGQALWNWDA